MSSLSAVPVPKAVSPADSVTATARAATATAVSAGATVPDATIAKSEASSPFENARFTTGRFFFKKRYICNPIIDPGREWRTRVK